ncbi:MAG: type III pantothenate kinase, partial [bacterium]|nr:type III pantothenate kinase [bacterium]
MSEKLLTVDIGNTNIVLGIYDGNDLAAFWRIATGRWRTADEWGFALSGLLRMRDMDIASIDAVVIGSVVPSLTQAWAGMCREALGLEPLLVSSAVDCGLTVLYDHPSDVGADRLANALAAYRRRGAAVVLDFGTATTLDAVSASGEYLGGAIMPGISISLDALYGRAARLSGVDLYAPLTTIGRNTGDSLRSGIIYGFAAQAEGMTRRFLKEMGEGTAVLATGGLAELVCGQI